MPNLWLVFTTGLFAGGVTCVAVQGGLLAALIAGNNKDKGNPTQTTVLFLGAKLLAATLLGALLGGLGSAIVISPRFLGVAQVVVAIYMLGVVGAILELHPVFRYFVISTPKFLTRWVRNQSKSDQWFGPILLGLGTVFIPCATTQAMMVSAVGTGSLLWGALTMFVFVTGTMPLFILIGLGVGKLGQVWQSRFSKVTAVVVCLVALTTFNNGLVLLASPITLQTVISKAQCVISYCPGNEVNEKTISNLVNIQINERGYTVDNATVKAGSEVKLKLTNTNGYGCQQAFTIPELNISQVVPVGESKELTVTIPNKKETLAFSCGMGMYTGKLNVVD